MAISVVQTQTGTGNPPVAFGTAVTVGNTIILIGLSYSTSGGNSTTSSVTLGGSTVTGTVAFFNPSTFAGVNCYGSLSSELPYICIWMLPNVQASGQTSVDVTFTGFGTGGVIGMTLYEVSGLGTTPGLDVSNFNSSTTATTINPGSSGAIRSSPEFIVAGSMSFGGAGSPSGGWTTQNPSTDYWTGQQIATSSGGSYSWSQTGAGVPWVSVIAAIATVPTPTSGPALTPYATVPRPVLVTSGGGWRGANHSR